MANKNLQGRSAGHATTFGSVPDELFGIPVPSYAPIHVFPLDPDFGFKRSRAWETATIPMSPLISQRYVLATAPLITWNIGFSAARGTLLESSSKARTLWDFFNSHKGAYTPFYFYDPAVWQTFEDESAVEKYRTDPTTRLYHPVHSESARYICHFQDDQLEAESFMWKLKKFSLVLVGYRG